MTQVRREPMPDLCRHDDPSWCNEWVKRNLKAEARYRFKLPTIQSALRFWQEQYGWTQSRMAKALGLSTGHYSEVLSGKRMLSYAAACRAFRIGIPASVLLSLKNRRRTHTRN